MKPIYVLDELILDLTISAICAAAVAIFLLTCGTATFRNSITSSALLCISTYDHRPAGHSIRDANHQTCRYRRFTSRKDQFAGTGWLQIVFAVHCYFFVCGGMAERTSWYSHQEVDLQTMHYLQKK